MPALIRTPIAKQSFGHPVMLDPNKKKLLVTTEADSTATNIELKALLQERRVSPYFRLPESWRLLSASVRSYYLKAYSWEHGLLL